MKIAVTSVSGQLGEAIAKELINEIGKENVIGLARTPENAAHLGIEIRKGDYNNPKDLEVALKGIDTLLLVSGNDHPEKRIAQHRNVIDAAKANSVQKIVYTSVVGDDSKTGFGPVVKSNRQTEKDIQTSELQWSIGRNGIYIEPDLEYIENYVKEEGITNCAGEGKCAYTNRTELAQAYTKMILNDNLNNKIYNLTGEAITQRELTECINKVFNTNLTYSAVSSETYRNERIAALGELFGTIISGIYASIQIGSYDISSDFKTVVGREHRSPTEMMESFRDKR